MVGGALAVALGLIPRSTLRLSLQGFDIDSIIEDISDNEKLLFPHGREEGTLSADELARFARDVAELLHSKDGPIHRLGPRLSEPELIAKLVAGGGPERPVGWRPFRLPLAPPQLLLARTLGLSMRSNTLLVMPSTVDGLDTLLADGNVVEGAPANDDERCGRLIDGHLWYDDTRSSSLGLEDEKSEKQYRKARGRGGDRHGIGRRDDGEFLGRFAVLDDTGIALAQDFYSSVLVPHVASLADPSLEYVEQSYATCSDDASCVLLSICNRRIVFLFLVAGQKTHATHLWRSGFRHFTPSFPNVIVCRLCGTTLSCWMPLMRQWKLLFCTKKVSGMISCVTTRNEATGLLPSVGE